MFEEREHENQMQMIYTRDSIQDKKDIRPTDWLLDFLRQICIECSPHHGFEKKLDYELYYIFKCNGAYQKSEEMLEIKLENTTLFLII